MYGIFILSRQFENMVVVVDSRGEAMTSNGVWRSFILLISLKVFIARKPIENVWFPEL